ncbi:MAG: transcriptional repressor [Clostridia bacterium]|nr:transcriptional repressor [Clostridia bacterium]
MAEEIKRRYSRQRELIYQYLLSTKAHPSAETIYEDLKTEIQGLSLGTVYRNLKLLEEMGMVRRIANYNDTERYDACCTDHVHFLCTSCGCIDDIDGVDTDSVRKTIPLNDGYQLATLSLTLTGLCPRCAEQHSKNLI